MSFKLSDFQQINGLQDAQTVSEILKSLTESATPFFIQKDDRLIYCNKAFEKFSQYPQEELKNKNFLDLIFPEDRLLISRLIEASLKRNEFPQKLEYRFQRLDHSLIPVLHFSYCSLQNGKVNYLLAHIYDNNLEYNLKKSAEIYRENLEKAFNSIQDAIVICNLAMRILFCNNKFLELLQLKIEEIKDEPLARIISARNLNKQSTRNGSFEAVDLNQILSFLITRKEKIEFDNWLLETKSGQLEIEGAILPFFAEKDEINGFSLIFSDLREKKLLEREKLKMSQLEALGQLAGGIAHDFNNLLMAMMGNITIIKEALKGNEKLTKRLQDCEEAAYKARDLTQQLLTFSRGGAPKKETIAIKPLLKEVAEFCLHGSNVRLELDLDDDLWLLEADESQLRQVIQNIVINADQAMIEGGVLKITARNIKIDKEQEKLKKGIYVHLIFQDTGHGIPGEIINRIFDPYFSTKPMGSGLGLSIVHSIVKKHEGYIFVESELNRGTAFHLYLPAIEEKASLAKEKPAETAAVEKKIRVLLMDDEELILDVTSEMLQMINCEVTTARDGIEALALYKEAMQKNSPFDVVILDLTIPGGIGGKDVLQELLKINPAVKAVVASGYCNEDVMANYQDFGFRASLMKPFKLDELKRAIKTALSN